MRYANLRTSGGPHLGVVLGEDILDLSADAVRTVYAGLPATMRDVFESSEIVEKLVERLKSDTQFRAAVKAAGAFVAVAAADLGPPIQDPSLLLAIGLNYRDHVREMGIAEPEIPYSFTKNLASIVGPKDDIVLPPSHPDRVDLEAELAIIIGTSCHNVSEAEAALCIGGYTSANDVSARDWVEGAFSRTTPMDIIGAWEVNLLGKQFPTFCPLGPYLVTRDEIGDVLDLRLSSRVNGETFQSTNTSELIFSPAKIVSYYSVFYRFEPGDVILTGTTSGVGYSRNPKRFLAAGDLVEVEIESIGSLANTVVAGAR